MTYNLEFKLPSISERLHLPIHPEALDICPSKEGGAKVPTTHEAAAHSKIHKAPLQPEKRRVKWTPEEEATLLQMRNDGLFVGKDPCCPPSPKHRDHPGALFDEVEKVIRRSYDVWMGRSEEAAIASLALGLLRRRRSSRQATMMTIQVTVRDCGCLLFREEGWRLLLNDKPLTAFC